MLYEYLSFQKASGSQELPFQRSILRTVNPSLSTVFFVLTFAFTDILPTLGLLIDKLGLYIKSAALVCGDRMTHLSDENGSEEAIPVGSERSNANVTFQVCGGYGY